MSGDTITVPTPFGEFQLPGWTEQGLCLQTDLDVFFPRHYSGRLEREAKAVCGGCPVRTECLHHALDRDERFGVWGGATPTERARLARASTRGRRDAA